MRVHTGTNPSAHGNPIFQKDAELMDTKDIEGATWHFFESPVTGKGGPSKPLMDELKKNDIKIEIH